MAVVESSVGSPADLLAGAQTRGTTSACLYCGDSHYRPLHSGIHDRLGYVPGQWSYLRCTQCGSSILSPTPAAEELAALYPPVYSFSPELAKAGTLKRFLASIEQALFYDNVYRAQTRIVDRHTRMPGATPGKLLDVGCGRGLRLRHFQSLGYEVQGMDFSADSVEYVRETLGIPAVCTDVAGLTEAFAAESFDLITAFFVLEHVTDVGEMLRQCLVLLKPGGWLAAAVPLADSNQARLLGSKWTQYTEAPRHISLPTQEALVDVCVRSGFDAAQVFVRSDSVLGNAGAAALSLLPASSTTSAFSRTGFAAVIPRLAAPVAVAACLPWAMVDRYCFGKSGRSGLGIVFARKPG